MSESLFLQKIATSKGYIDLSFLKECWYCEEFDLSGPVLQLKFDDKDRIIRDRLGLKEGSEIDVFFADYWMKDNIQHTAKFRIMSMPVANGFLVLNCFHSALFSLKDPVKESLLFTKKDVKAIAKRLLPSWQIFAIGNFPVSDDYHVLPGQRPSVMLRKLAREKAAAIFFQRNKFVIKRLSDFMALNPVFNYEHSNSQAENRVITFKAINSEPILKDALDRNYQGWNMNSGWISGSSDDMPLMIHSSPNKNTLANIKAYMAPVIDFTCSGNGGLMPGVPISFTWNTEYLDAPIDESLPEKIVALTVIHQYTPQKYFCRVKGGILK